MGCFIFSSFVLFLIVMLVLLSLVLQHTHILSVLILLEVAIMVSFVLLTDLLGSEFTDQPIVLTVLVVSASGAAISMSILSSIARRGSESTLSSWGSLF